MSYKTSTTSPFGDRGSTNRLWLIQHGIEQRTCTAYRRLAARSSEGVEPSSAMGVHSLFSCISVYFVVRSFLRRRCNGPVPDPLPCLVGNVGTCRPQTQLSFDRAAHEKDRTSRRISTRRESPPAPPLVGAGGAWIDRRRGSAGGCNASIGLLSTWVGFRFLAEGRAAIGRPVA